MPNIASIIEAEESANRALQRALTKIGVDIKTSSEFRRDASDLIHRVLYQDRTYGIKLHNTLYGVVVPPKDALLLLALKKNEKLLERVRKELGIEE
jgi:hypothetical protein